MIANAEWGTMDINSKNQRWSRWTMGIDATKSRQPSPVDVRENALRFFGKGFQSSAGRLRVTRYRNTYTIVVEIEGPPVHDPDYREAVRRQVRDRFVMYGFGPSAKLSFFEAGLLAGSAENGQPPAQLIVMPFIGIDPQLFAPDPQQE